MMKLKAAFLACSMICGSAMADAGITKPIVVGSPVEINGMSLQRVTPEITSYSARPGVSKGVYSGDELMDQAGMKRFTVSGSLLVRVGEGEARQLADKYGLEVMLSAGGISSFKTKQGTELTSLLKRLKEENKQVQLELVHQKMQPM